MKFGASGTVRSVVIVVVMLPALRCAPHGPPPVAFPRQAAVFPVGNGLERMLVTDPPDSRAPYQAVWRRSDSEDAVVCMRYPGLELCGTPYDITVSDADGTVVRRGQITAGQDATPYCLVEVRAQNHRLPQGLRGEWLLAVGFAGTSFWQHAGHVVLSGMGEDLVPLTNPPPTRFYLELPRWEDQADKPRFGIGNLFDAADADFRWAEAGPDLLGEYRPSGRLPCAFVRAGD